MAKSKSVSNTSTKVEMTVVERAKAFYQRAKAYESDQREQEMDDIRFAGLLEQWPAQLKEIREGDPQGARPCLVVDKVNQYKNQIVNQMRQARPGIKARPVDDAGDVEVAEVYQGIIRHIEDASKADIAYDWAGEGAVTSGTGYFRIITEYVGDSFQQEIRIARIRNRFTVYFDPNAKEPDGSDQTECLITTMIPRKEFEEMYPDIEVSEWSASTGDSDWYDIDNIRIAEYFYIEKSKETLYLLEDGNSIFKSEYEEKYLNAPIEELQEPMQEAITPQEQAPTVLKQREGYRTIVKWCKVTGAETLEETTVPGVFIPVVRVIGIETDIDGKLYLRGVVRGVKDAQRMYNYQRSTVVETLALSSKAPWVAAAGQVEGFEAEWASSNRVNRAVLKYKPVNINGMLAPPPQRQGYAGVPTGLIQDMQTSEHDIQSALGMYQASIGQDGNAKSGRAMNAQQKQGDMATFQFPDNQSKSIRHGGRIIMGMIPVIYDTPQVIRILGEDGTASYAKIDPEQKEAVKHQREMNGAITKIYNLGVGKYDVTITTGSNYATKRMEGADFLTQIVQSSPDLMPVIGDLLFKSMDMPYAEEISERMKKMMPPQLQENDDGESPEVQQVKQQAKQAVDQLSQQLDAAHQAMQEAEQEAKELQSKADDTSGKVAIEAKKLEIDWYKAETDRLKVEIDAAQNAELDPQRIQLMEDAIAKMIDMLPQHELSELPQQETMQPPSGGFSLPEGNA
ncbi:MAG: portal protein [Pseudomonadota bacterium]